ncbi:MAG: ribbon-helix-helix protein, CopG family [Desulfobacteraceae bacterium]
MANVTLKIDDDLLKKARHIAAEKKISINAIIREKIEEFVSQNSRKETFLMGLESFYDRCKAQIGIKTRTRDEIHER